MASVKKQSLREEYDALKGRFEGLCAEGKMGQESRALFQALLMLFDLLFRTWFDADRRPPAQIGIREAMPPGFLAQLASPFRKAAALQGALPATVPGAPSSGVSSDL